MVRPPGRETLLLCGVGVGVRGFAGAMVPQLSWGADKVEHTWRLAQVRPSTVCEMRVLSWVETIASRDWISSRSRPVMLTVKV